MIRERTVCCNRGVRLNGGCMFVKMKKYYLRKSVAFFLEHLSDRDGWG